METETIEAADGAKAPRNQPHQNGSLSIAPASTAREIPGWPKAVMKTTPGSGRYAHLVGRPEGCEVTVVCDRGKRIETTTVPVDSWPHVQKFTEKTPGIDFPLLMAGYKALNLSKQWGNEKGGLPFTVVLNAQGQIHWRHSGALDIEALRSMLESGDLH